MSKWCGNIGFFTTEETSPGVWEEQIIERQYYGDVLHNYEQTGGVEINSDINISNIFSIVADPFAYENFHHMRYVTYMGTKWKINSAEVEYPRITLSVGGIYNEQS